MRGFLFLIVVLFISVATNAQKTINAALKKFNEGSVPYISVKELSQDDNSILFDTREKEEFAVSHIQNAEWVGYDNFKLERILKKYPDKNKSIIVYCSIGVRSEQIGEKLQKAGYTHVKNLYGGIFQWKNEGHSVFDDKGTKTEKVHAFNKQWGKLLTNGKKVYGSKPE